jgi:hypothetical protein
MGKPPPFQRPGIALGRHNRSWQTIKATELRVGDIVRDKGLVLSIEDRSEWSAIDVDMVNGEHYTFDVDDLVTAFSKKPLTEDSE